MPSVAEMFTDKGITYINITRATPRETGRSSTVVFAACGKVCSKRHWVTVSPMPTMATDVRGTVIAYDALAFVAPSLWCTQHDDDLVVCSLHSCTRKVTITIIERLELFYCDPDLRRSPNGKGVESVTLSNVNSGLHFLKVRLKVNFL